jgi:hypothetical protein
VVLGDAAGPAGAAGAIVTDGYWMYVLGTDYPGGARWHLEKRRLADGAPDLSFGAAGVLIVDPTAGDDYAFHLALDGDSLYIAGAQDGGSGERYWRIEKRSACTGAPDAAFGGGTGAVTATRAGAFDNPAAIAVQGGSLYVAGTEGPVGGTDSQWRIEKRDATSGAPDAVFGGGTGVVRSNPGSAQDEAHAMALDAASLYVVGLQHLNAGDYGWRIEKRDRVTGDPDGTFGAGSGAVTNNPYTNSYDDAQAVAVSGNSLYVGGFREYSGGTDREWRVEKRDAATGVLDVAGFGSPDGYVTTNSGTLNESVAALIVDGPHLYVGGTYDDTSLLDLAWRIEKRDASSGTLDSAFGASGTATENPTGGEDALYGMAVAFGAVYAVGQQEDGPGVRWRIEKRVR